MSTRDWLTAGVAIYGAGMSTYAIRRQVLAERRSSEVLIGIEIREEIGGPRPLLTTGAGTVYSDPSYEILIDATNHSGAQKFIRAVDLELIEAEGGWQFHSPNDANVAVERGQTHTFMRKIVPTDAMWSNDFIVTVTLGSGETFSSPPTHLDPEAVDEFKKLKPRR